MPLEPPQSPVGRVGLSGARILRLDAASRVLGQRGSSMTTILCVLRSGGIYGPQHVARLYEQVRQHAPGVEMMALTDVPAVLGVGCRVRGLQHFWPGWWSKIEALSLPGPCVMLDLDVSITDSLAPLLAAAEQHDLIAARCFWPGSPHTINSSVVAWRGDVSSLYREFAAAPNANMDVYGCRERWGDQAYLRDHWRGEIARWQDVLPGMVCSFKCGALKGEDLSDCRVLVSHGVPRPWDADGADAWLKRHAYSLA